VEKRAAQQAAVHRLRAVAAEVHVLNEEQARLARGFPRDEATMTARAEPRAERRTPADPGRAGVIAGRAAGVDGRSAGRTVPVGQSWHRTDLRVVAAAPAPTGATGATGPAEGRRGPRALPAKRSAAGLPGELAVAWPGVSRDPLSQPAPLDVAFWPDGGSLPEGAARARGALPGLPVLTVPARPYDDRLIAHGGPEVAIPAAPGQAVAAPVEGRVVFAGSFKSYGLLLILEHEGEYHTLLWGFARLAVRQGDQVQVGRIVGIMDARGDGPPVLHVERRRRGRPVDIAASSNGIQG
jgi:hypothetical protein